MVDMVIVYWGHTEYNHQPFENSIWPPCWLQASSSAPPPPALATTAPLPGSLLHSLVICQPNAIRLCPYHITGKALASVTSEFLIPKVLSSLASRRKSPSPFCCLHTLTSLVHLRLLFKKKKEKDFIYS